MPEFTGERVVPGLVDPNLFNEHIARYEFAKRFAAGARVLDAGCGSGYGAAALAESAREVTGIDAAEDAVAYAREHYGTARFEQGSCTALPEGPFDLITAFEVIEHLEDWPTFLDEARRALAPMGVFLVSTPNRDYYAESRGAAGANPFHVHEFDFAEFQRELAARFPHVAMLVQNHAECIVFSPVLAQVEQVIAQRGLLRAADPETAHFFLAVCSSAPLADIAPFVFLPSAANVLRERERHIALLEDEVRKKSDWHEQARAELAERNREYDALLADVRRLNRELEQRNQWALAAKAESDARGARIIDLQKEASREQAEFAATAAAYEARVAATERESRDRLEWGWETERRLEAEVAEASGTLARAVALLNERETIIEERTLWAQDLEKQLAASHQRFDALREEWWVRTGRRFKFVADRD